MHGVLVRDFGDAQPLLANTKPCNVHHDEHGREALIFFADKITRRAIIVHDAGRVAMNTHFVLNRTTGQCVARAKRTVVIHKELRYDEKRNAFDGVGRAGRFREHEVYDVLGEVMFT